MARLEPSLHLLRFIGSSFIIGEGFTNGAEIEAGIHTEGADLRSPVVRFHTLFLKSFLFPSSKVPQRTQPTHLRFRHQSTAGSLHSHPHSILLKYRLHKRSTAQCQPVHKVPHSMAQQRSNSGAGSSKSRASSASNSSSVSPLLTTRSFSSRNCRPSSINSCRYRRCTFFHASPSRRGASSSPSNSYTPLRAFPCPFLQRLRISAPTPLTRILRSFTIPARTAFRSM